jgi:hypothetical protein
MWMAIESHCLKVTDTNSKESQAGNSRLRMAVCP